MYMCVYVCMILVNYHIRYPSIYVYSTMFFCCFLKSVVLYYSFFPENSYLNVAHPNFTYLLVFLLANLPFVMGSLKVFIDS